MTELLADRIWPSLFVGITAGVVAGITTFASPYYTPPREYRRRESFDATTGGSVALVRRTVPGTASTGPD